MDPLAFKLELLDASAELTGYVTAQQIADNAVGTSQLANNAVTATKIANGTITESKLSFSPTTTGKAIAMAIVFGG